MKMRLVQLVVRVVVADMVELLAVQALRDKDTLVLHHYSHRQLVTMVVVEVLEVQPQP